MSEGQGDATRMGRARGRGRASGPKNNDPADIADKMGAMDLGSSKEGGHGDSQMVPVGRGAMRGRYTESRELMCTRPQHIQSKQGSAGRQIPMMANFYGLIGRPKWSIKQYAVSFNPDEDNTRLRKRYLREFKKQLGEHYVFDGNSLFMERKLANEEETFTTKRETDEQVIHVKVRFVAELSQNDFQCLQIFNIIVNQCMNFLGLTKLKKQDTSFFDVNQSSSVNRGQLEIWPGYSAAINQYERSVLMCVSVANKVLRCESVLTQLKQLRQSNQGTLVDEAEKALLGCVVLCRHNMKTYRVDDILWDKSPKSTFDMHGEQVSVMEYYKRRHNIDVLPEQPLLCSRPKKKDRRGGQDQPFWLVPQLCLMTGLSESMRNDFRLMKEVAAFTNQGPSKQQEKLRSFSEKMMRDNRISELLSFWGMKLSNDLIKVPARQLQPEKIKTDKLSEARNGAWNDAVKTGLAQICHLENWILFYPQRCAEEAAKLTTIVMRAASSFRMRVAEPQKVVVMNDRVHAYVETVDRTITQRHQLVMCLIGSKDKTKYDAIKQLLCLRKPVPSQVVTAHLIRTNKNVMGVASKIAIQLNCKLGGVPWEVNVPLKGCMIVGYDTFHESTKSTTCVGAWVATMNSSCTRYFSCAQIHERREELSSHMQVNMCESLRRYRHFNNAFPNTIIVYRDGVSDGQVRYVREMEVKAIRDACAAMKADVKITFILVVKRISTRLFFSAGGSCDNPPSGTVVDDVITMPHRYDFYLVAQTTRQGTVSPTLYNIIEDESSLKPEHMQMLTYKLTHLYFNMSSTISEPAPIRYAHRLAFMVGQSLHKSPHSSLSNELFYL